MSLPPRGWEIPKELHPTEEGATVGPNYLTIGASGGPGLLDHCHPLIRSSTCVAIRSVARPHYHHAAQAEVPSSAVSSFELRCWCLFASEYLSMLLCRHRLLDVVYL